MSATKNVASDYVINAELDTGNVDPRAAFMARAAGKFMTIRVVVRRWEGVKRSRKAAALAEEGAGAASGVVNSSVNLLGKHHADLKRVKAANARLNTYLYEQALPSDIEGEYMFHVDQVPTVYSNLLQLKAEAEAVLEDFLPLYDQFVRAARGDLADLSKGVNYPSVDDVRAKFEIIISAPDFVPVADVERFKHLPLAQAADWAVAAEAKVASKMESARDYILDQTRVFMADVEKALANKTFRTTDKKIREVQLLSAQLRRLVQDWDNEPHLLALADLIDEKITPAITGRNLKHDHVKKNSVRRAAKTVVAGIDKHKKNQARLAEQAANAGKSAAPQGEIIGGGMLADLM